MRKALDMLYAASGALAALFIVLICVVVAAQVTLNLVTRIFGSAYSLTIPSYADFAGFFLAASSFLALAYTLTRGSHIRVNLLLQTLRPGPRLLAELFSLGLGAVLSGYAAWFMIRLNIDSWRFGDLSYGIIAIPIWVPQLAVSAGLVVLTVAFTDLFVQTLRARAPVLRDEGSE